MKRKTRTLTVNGRRFVWRYEIGRETVLRFTPESDRTACAEAVFAGNACPESDWRYPAAVELERDGIRMTVKTCSPKMAALLLSELPDAAFVPRHTERFDAYALLRDMRYTVGTVTEGLFW